jgi:hypothetical protein
MQGDIAIFEIIRPFMFWASPLIFLFGVILVLYSNYRKLEEFLGQEIGGVKRRVVLAIETNIYVFHEWLIERRTLTGVTCIIFSILFFFVFRNK